MNKQKIFLLALLMLTIPFATHAFSWRSLAFWEKEKTVITQEKPKEFDANQQKLTQAKIAEWQKAFSTKKWDKLIKNKNNFVINQDEVNFFIKEALSKSQQIPVENISVTFVDNKINVKGQLLKPIKGGFETIIRIDKGKTNELLPVVEKIKFKGIPVPKFYVNDLIQKYFPDVSSFLYTYPNYKGLDVQIDSGSLKLNYK